MVRLEDERDLETLRQVSILLDNENRRLIDKVRRLALENARLRGVTDSGQRELELIRELELARERVFRVEPQQPKQEEIPAERKAQRGHGPRPQQRLPVVEHRYELSPEQKKCNQCGRELREMKGQYQESERVTVVKLSYQLEHNLQQKYYCSCGENVVTADGPAQLIPGGRYSPEFAVEVAVAKYADHLPLERQVKMMAREGLEVDSQTLWDQLNALARHLEPTYEALGKRVLNSPVLNADESGWPLMGKKNKPAAGTVWALSSPEVAFYRMMPGKSSEEGQQVFGDYRGIAVVDGFKVYQVLARKGPNMRLAHCWAHVKRKFSEIAEQFPTACSEILELIGELYAVEKLVPVPFPGDEAAQKLRHRLRQERSKAILDRIWKWATVQQGLPRSDFGKAVRYLLEHWKGLTVFVEDPRVPLDNNAAERALRGPVVGRKNHYGSRSLRGTHVAALFYTLCETAKLAGVDPRSYLLAAVLVAIDKPGTVTFPESLASASTT